MKDVTDSILQKGRKKNVVRDVAIYLSRDLSGESDVDLGKYFGKADSAQSQVEETDKAD